MIVPEPPRAVNSATTILPEPIPLGSFDEADTDLDRITTVADLVPVPIVAAMIRLHNSGGNNTPAMRRMAAHLAQWGVYVRFGPPGPSTKRTPKPKGGRRR